MQLTPMVVSNGLFTGPSRKVEFPPATQPGPWYLVDSYTQRSNLLLCHQNRRQELAQIFFAYCLVRHTPPRLHVHGTCCPRSSARSTVLYPLCSPLSPVSRPCLKSEGNSSHVSQKSEVINPPRQKETPFWAQPRMHSNPAFSPLSGRSRAGISSWVRGTILKSLPCPHFDLKFHPEPKKNLFLLKEVLENPLY